MGLLGRGGDRGATRYTMQEKLFSIGDDAWIENAEGEKVYKADGKALRMRNTFILEDRAGTAVASIQQKMLHVRDTMEIERDGQTIAKVQKALVAPLRDRFKIELTPGGEWEAQGNVLDHEYEIKNGRDKIAEISKKWVRVRDTYNIEVEPGQDDGLVITIAIAIDEMRRGE